MTVLVIVHVFIGWNRTRLPWCGFREYCNLFQSGHAVFALQSCICCFVTYVDAFRFLPMYFLQFEASVGVQA